MEGEGPSFTRVETLIPYRDASFAPRRALGALDPDKDRPTTVCAKLGRFLLSALPEGGEAGAACMAAEWLLPDGHPEPIPEPERGSLLATIANNAVSCRRSMFRYGDGSFMILAHGPGVRERFLGQPKLWHLKGDPSRDVRLAVVRLDVALGAMELLEAAVPRVSQSQGGWTAVDEAWEMMRLSSSGYRQLYGPLRQAFYEAALARWEEEGCRAENRRHAQSGLGGAGAGVFEDKKHCDAAHREAASNGYFASAFSHVEVDDEVDLGAFRDLQDEFEARAGAGEMPPADYAGLGLRFRKTGRHRAIGLYCHAFRALAVDPRAPHSMLHELAHAYDYEQGMLSCSKAFRPILRDYKARLEGVPASKRAYYETPTEVFARAWEVHASLNGRGGSFVPRPDALADLPEYAPLIAARGDVEAYFAALLPPAAEAQAPHEAGAREAEGMAQGPTPPSPAEPAPERPPLPEVPVGAQMPLFYLGEDWMEASGGERDDLFASSRAAPPDLGQACAAARAAAGAAGNAAARKL